MTKELSQWVCEFSGRRVLLVGDLILDRYLYGDAERISPEAPVPVLRTVESRTAVGGSANVSSCLRALGCHVACCGTTGVDANGETLRSMLRDQGVDVSGLLAVAKRPTTTKTRLVGLAQHRHRQQLLRVDEEDTSPLPEEEAARLIDLACERVAEADVICLEDYDKGVVTDALVRRVVEEAKRCGKPVLADPARLSDYGRYRQVNILTPNRQELAIATGRSLDSLDEVAEAACELLASLDVGAIVATVDRDGAMLVEKGQPPVHLRTVPRSVYDNTGAGDAVLAMLAAAVASGADLQAATRLANMAGGLEVEKFGCVPVSTEEVLAELRLQGGARNGKLRNVEELMGELGLRRDRGETIAFTNGCYDILHAGHVDFLQRCRQEASVLVVGLNTDASIQTLEKGTDRPINKFADRANVLCALSCVDYVVGFEESTPESLIQRVAPDVLIKGDDWANKTVAGAAFVESKGGRLVLLPLVEGLSTTNLIERIRGKVPTRG